MGERGQPHSTRSRWTRPLHGPQPAQQGVLPAISGLWTDAIRP